MKRTWKDGTEDTVDMTPIIQQSAPFGHLENTEIFSQVTVIDWGCGLDWPDDVGFGADTLNQWVNTRQPPWSQSRSKRVIASPDGSCCAKAG
ncbi:MAG: DUF2442 domain-containing protein [Magnetococcales bacterium]|nr:DUF2442 domain-containing protein [Magnetococcales bacterium]